MEPFLFIVVLIAIVAYIVWQNSNQSDFTDIIVIHDLTEKRVVPPDADTVLKYYGFDNDMSKKAIFRLAHIGDHRIYPCKEVRLPFEEKVRGYNQDRFEKVRAFCAEVKQALNKMHDSEGTPMLTENIECYMTIAQEINIFSGGTANKKVLIIHSPLIEHSSIFDSTSTYGRGLIETKPEEVAKMFTDQFRIGPMKGIEVIFAYTPIDAADAIRYSQMTRVYWHIFKNLEVASIVSYNHNRYAV